MTTKTKTPKYMLDTHPRATHIVIEGRKTTLCGKPVDDPYDPQWYFRTYDDASTMRRIREEASCKECKRAMHERRMKELPAADRKTLRASLDYMDDHDRALQLWLDGFRPIYAEDLEVGMVVAYRDTDVFRFGPVGPVRTATVTRIVEGEYGERAVEHTGGETEVDEGDEVWIRKENH